MFRKKGPGEEAAPALRPQPAAEEEPKLPQPRRPASLPIRPLTPPPDLGRRADPGAARSEISAAPLGTSPALVREKCLLIGKGVKLKGEVPACDKVLVEGEAELQVRNARTLQVAPSGVFRGRAEVVEADIAGVFEGELIARERLSVQGSGRMSGRISYGQITIAAGGRVSGEISGLPPAGAAAAPKVGEGQNADGAGDGPAGQPVRLSVAATDRP